MTSYVYSAFINLYYWYYNNATQTIPFVPADPPEPTVKNETIKVIEDYQNKITINEELKHIFSNQTPLTYLKTRSTFK